MKSAPGILSTGAGFISTLRKPTPERISRKPLIVEYQLPLDLLPHGVVVGEVELTQCRPATPRDEKRAKVSSEVLAGNYAWELANPVRFDQPLPALVKPYGSWFYPFKRRAGKQ
ncbi:MAG: hypothetical protein R3C11_12310 [Planctomycetaceae bacterium]